MSQRFAESDSREGLVEEPVDARRYIEALRDRGRLILGLAVMIAVLVWLISLALPKRYAATAKIAPSTTSSASGSPTQTNFATLQAYVTSPTVLALAGRKLGASPASLQQTVTTSFNANADIVNVTASDGDARRSAQVANGVAEAFLNARTAAERAQLVAQANSLTQKMVAARAAGSTGLGAALQQQISNVLAQEASAGSDLQLLALAPVPASTSSSPARNAFFAFVAVLFIGVLVVLARELLAPSISSDRELSALMGMPILGRIPRIAPDGGMGRTAADPVEAEAYRFLSRSIEMAAWPTDCRVLAVTSAARGEGKTTLVSRLGAALAEAGSRTLLVGADLRRPALDRVFGLTSDDGLGNVLSSPNPNRAAAEPSPIEQVAENLYVLPSGRPLHNPAAVISNDAVRSLFERVRQLGFDYVLFDLPPLIAAAETQLFVRYADAAMVVSMLGRADTEQLSETRELLSRLPVRPAGIVVLGVRTAVRDAPRNASGIVAQLDGWVRQRGDLRSARSRPAPDPESLEPAVYSDRSEPAVISGHDAPVSTGHPPSPVADPPPPALTPEPVAPPSRRQPRHTKAPSESSSPATSAEPTSTTPRRRRLPRTKPSEASSRAPSPELTPTRPPRRPRQKKASSQASPPASPVQPGEPTPRRQIRQATEPPEPPLPK